MAGKGVRVRAWPEERAVLPAGTPHRPAEVDVAPAQRQQLAEPQSSERGGEEDRRVLLGGRSADQRHDLLRREHLEIAAALQRWLLDLSCRVHRQPPDLLRALEDSM